MAMIADQLHSPLMNRKRVRQQPLRPAGIFPRFDPFNIRIRQLAERWWWIPNMASMAALSRHVNRIVFGRPEKEMLRINAKRDIAMVKNPHSVWNWAIGSLPSKSMSPEVTDLPITIFLDAPIPKNASVRTSPNV